MASRKILPLLNRVVIKRSEVVKKTASGVILPESSLGKANQGIVVAAGPGLRSEDGKFLGCSVKEGDKVLLAEWGGQSVKLDGQELFIMRDDELLGVLHE